MDTITKKYEDLYKTEQYALVASTDIYVPWMSCTLKCKYRTRQPLTEFDSIIIKCVKKNINTIRDIAFVLCIDRVLVEAEIDSLAGVNLLEIVDEIICITEKGNISFEERMKDEILTEEIPIYMNCISGQWKVDAHDFVSEKGIEPQKIHSDEDKVSQIKPIVLEPKIGVSKEAVESDTKLIKEINKKYNVHIISVCLMQQMVTQYQKERVLFFRSDNKQVLFSLCDYENYELDDKLASALRKHYERRQLLEVLQIEKFAKEAEKYLASEEPVVVKYKNQICGNRYLRNQDIRKLFTGIFEKAEKSIFIIAPWIDNNKYVMTDDILNKMEAALKKNVLITIGYGYTNKDKLEKKINRYKKNINNDEIMKKDKDYQTYLMAEKMREYFKTYDNFYIFHVGTHEKILSYDDQFTLISSYNFMSYDGGESEDYTGYNFRYEGGVLIEDFDFAKHVKSCFDKQ